MDAKEKILKSWKLAGVIEQPLSAKATIFSGRSVKKVGK